MSEEQNILASKRFDIIEGLIVDHTKKCVVTPYKKEIADKIPLISYIKELYDDWETYPSGTVIRYECPQAKRIVQENTKNKVFRKPDEEMMKKYNLDERFLTNQDLFFAVHNSMSGIEADCICIKFPGNKHVYLFTKVPENDTPCSFAYRSSDGINTGYESTTGLTTFYKLNGFRAWLKKQDFPENSMVYAVEIKQVMYYLYFHFAAKEHLMNLDVANTGTMRVETAMGNHTIGTLDRYLKFLSTAYFYLLNVGKYQNCAEVNDEIVDKIKVLRDNVGDAADEQGHIIYARLEEKVRLLREIMVLMLDDEAAFSFPVKASVLDEAGELRHYEYCVKVFNSYKLFIKYLLIHTNGKRVPREFLKAFEGERGYQPLENFNAVYATILKKRNNYTATMTRRLANGSVMVNGFIFTPQLIASLYKKLKDEYNQGVSDLNAYIQVVGVERCHGQLRGRYQYKHESSFYSCFPASDMNALVADTNISFIDDTNREKVFAVFDRLCSAIVALVILSSGSTMRLQEYPRLTQCAPQSMFLFQGDSEEYCYFSTDVNKNNSLKRRFLFVNPEVSKYLVHYCCIVKRILNSISVATPMDRSLFSLEEKMRNFEANEELIDTVTSTEVMRDIGTQQFLRTYIFVSTVVRRKKRYITKAVTKRVTFLFQKLGGELCTAAAIRQAYTLFNEQVFKEQGFEIMRTMGMMLNNFAGHHYLTGLNNYGFDGEVLQDSRQSGFNVALDVMVSLNKMLGMMSDADEQRTVPVVEKAIFNELVFGYEELKQAKRELYPKLTFKENQEAELRCIGATNMGILAPVWQKGSFVKNVC